MSVRKEVFSGMAYTAVAKYSGVFISLAITAVLARLILPEDFGVIALASVVIGFFGLLTDIGIAPAIVQFKDLSKDDLSRIFSFTFWIGVLLSLVFFSLSWVIADYYQSEDLIIVCQLLSVTLFFSAITIVPNGLLLRDKQFKFIAMRTLIVQILSGGIAVAMAFKGYGIFALIASPLCSRTLMFILSFRKFPQKLQFTLGLVSIKKIMAYTLYQFMFNLINFFLRTFDTLLIGKVLGMNSLGYYEKSYRLMTLPLENITHVIGPVLHPIFSDFQDDKMRMARAYEKAIKAIAFLSFPLSVFLHFSAAEIVLLFFGDQWVKSISVFEILAITVGAQVILSTSGPIFQAINATRMMFISGLISAATTIPAIAIGVYFYQSLDAVAYGILIAFSLNFLINYFLMYRYIFKLPLSDFYKQLWSPALLAAILVGTFMLLPQDIVEAHKMLNLCYNGVIFVGITVLYIHLTGAYNIKEMLKAVRSKIGR